MIEICLNVGLAQITDRFKATFLPQVDDSILEANEQAEHTGRSLSDPLISSGLGNSVCQPR